MTLRKLAFALRGYMKKATENDTDLLAEVQLFRVESVFRARALLSDYETSCIVIGVVRWLQVRLLRVHQLDLKDRLPHF